MLYCWAQELLTFCVFCDDLFWVSEAVSFSYLGVLSQILYVYLYHHYCNRTQHILCKYGYSLLAGISDWWPVIFTNQLTVFCDLTSPILPLGTFGLFSVPVHVSSLSLYAYSSTLSSCFMHLLCSLHSAVVHDADSAYVVFPSMAFSGHVKLIRVFIFSSFLFQMF